PEDRATLRQDEVDGTGVKGLCHVLERALPTVQEADERVFVLVDALADDASDDGIETGAVAASGQYSDAHARSLPCTDDEVVRRVRTTTVVCLAGPPLAATRHSLAKTIVGGLGGCGHRAPRGERR